jgi:hypothetical protein
METMPDWGKWVQIPFCWVLQWSRIFLGTDAMTLPLLKTHKNSAWAKNAPRNRQVWQAAHKYAWRQLLCV